MKATYTFAILFLFLLSCITKSKLTATQRTALAQSIDSHFVDGSNQYKLLMTKIKGGQFPKNYNPQTGILETSKSDWWCSGFYPGTLLYLYEQTKDPVLLTEANRILGHLEKEKKNSTTHDLGFMMFCSFGNANRLTPKPAYNDILMTSARSLATRFNPTVGTIKSWDGKASEYLVIIDNMMNLELLFWATKHSGDSSFYKIAVTHADNTMKNHFRKDYSSYHVVNYNSTNGAINKKRTEQGYADESAWARGQAWGLYGYTLMYRETKNKKYLDQAKKIANFVLDHPNLPADKIPYWDFNAPNIPNALRDASAGAVIAAALLELSTYSNAKDQSRYFNSAEAMLHSLTSPAYKANVGSNGGFILQHSVGHLPQKSEVDVAISYADYYFIEALGRYKKLIGR